MTIVKIMQMQQKIAKKLMAAIAMLLVATVLMGVTTYAWVTFSTAPEADNIKTTVGGNGYLEIALQSSAGQGAMSRAEITSGRGDSLLNTKARNTKWGNVIQLDNTYGLDSITIYPSRLNVNPVNQSVNTNGYLSIPEFGTDGRITQLNGASFLTYTPGDSAQFTIGRTYGVNVLGTVGEEFNENETITYHYRRSMIRDEAAGYLENYRTSLRNEIIDLLKEQEVGIFNFLFRAAQLFASGQINPNLKWTANNIATAKELIKGMISITRKAEPSLKWALLATAIADDTTYPPDSEEAMNALGKLYKEFQTYPLTSSGDEKSIKSIAEANGYTDLVAAVESITRAENQLGQALTYISNDATVSNACILIIDIQNTFLKNGSEIETDGPGTGNPATGTPRTLYAKEGNVSYGLTYNASHQVYTDYLYFTGATPGPTNGLFSIMANLLGDYQVTDQAYFKASATNKFQADSENGTLTQYSLHIRATGKNGSGDNAAAIAKSAVSKFNVETNRGVLGTVYDDIMDYDPGNAMISFSVNKGNGSAFGYSIDLAFRTNEDCNLLLSQNALDRVLGVDDQIAQDTETNSTMGGGSIASFTLSGDMIGTNSNIAKDLIENIYVVLIDTDSGAILGIVAADDTQVQLEQSSANLAIFEPNVSESGILSKGEKRSSNIITSMTKNRPVYITAIVFLNGDTLPSGSLAATQHPSLYGTINLQFASSALLTPMSYSGYSGE